MFLSSLLDLSQIVFGILTIGWLQNFRFKRWKWEFPTIFLEGYFGNLVYIHTHCTHIYIYKKEPFLMENWLTQMKKKNKNEAKFVHFLLLWPFGPFWMIISSQVYREANQRAEGKDREWRIWENSNTASYWELQVSFFHLWNKTKLSSNGNGGSRGKE